MKNEKLLYAIGNIDDELILGASKHPRIKRTWLKWAGTAACLCLLLITAALLGSSLAPTKSPGSSGGSQINVAEEDVRNPKMEIDLSDNSDESQIHVTQGGVRIPKLKIDLPDNSSAASMIAFFIYQGRCYVAYDTVSPTPGLMGNCLGTSTGSINEWSTPDAYVELSGSIAGDFYSVSGYDPSFMLCMEEEDGLRLYINDNGITLKTGSDLFEDRLHLAGRYELVRYQTREDWYYDNGNIQSLDDSSAEILADFVAALNEAPFMWIDDIPISEEASSVYDEKEIYHMYFQMEDGVTIHLRLFEGGYVQFDGIMGVCVQIPEDCMKAMVERLRATG